MSFDPADPIGSVFADIIGKRAWLVRKGYSSMLTMEFGEPHLRVREVLPEAKAKALRRPLVTVRGDWHLWVHSCDWRIREGGADVAHSEGTDAEIERGARALDGQLLLGVEVDPASSSSRLRFELGTTLEMTAYDRESESWLLYATNGHVLSLRGDGRYSWGPGDTRPDREVWVPLEQRM
jgi:hypothetical protein